MPNTLTPEQLDQLRATPVEGVNRLRLAITLADTTQTAVAQETGIPAPSLSLLVNGKYGDLKIETARKLASCFGCAIEDLFPSREAVA